MVSPSGGTMTIGEIPFTPRAKRVLEEAARRALAAERDHLPLRSRALESIAGALTRKA